MEYIYLLVGVTIGWHRSSVSLFSSVARALLDGQCPLQLYIHPLENRGSVVQRVPVVAEIPKTSVLTTCPIHHGHAPLCRCTVQLPTRTNVVARRLSLLALSALSNPLLSQRQDVNESGP